MLGLLWAGLNASAQVTATLSGWITDPSGASVGGARVTLSNPVAGFHRELTTPSDGAFSFTNVPYHTYELMAEKDGFAVSRQAFSLRSNIPQRITVRLTLEQTRTEITVTAESRSLVDPEETGTHAQMNQYDIDRLASGAGARGLESVLVGFPGFAKNANGAIHPRGAHNQMTYVIDGMPISDQLTGAFANAVDPAIAQTVELFTGNISAEYGGKVGAVANVTTRSGLGTGKTFSGNTYLDAARFDTFTQVTQVAGERGRFGYSAAINTSKSNRYLDQVSLDNLHNGGNSERGFLRLDFIPDQKNTLRFSATSGRSSFQLANLRSQHASRQDQRQLLRDLSVSTGWVRVLNPVSTFDTTLSYRTTVAQLFPSQGDTPVTAAQARHLSTLTLGSRFNRVAGMHTFRMGADYQHFPVSEDFSFGLTDPAFNPPGAPGFIPTLRAHDLSRGGRLFHFSRRDAGNMYSGFVQDDIQWRRLRLSLGLRYDNYRFLVAGNQLQPRVGLSFHIRETGTVLRASYNRTYQTPPNENILLSNSDQAGVLVAPDVRETLGGALVRIRPERQNVYEAGLQQAIGGKLSVNAAFYHKDSRDQQDNDNFFNTGIIFPISLARIRVNGAEARLVTLPVRGFSGSLALTHSRAVSTPPFTGGLFLGSSAIQALSLGPFVIDHDQKLGLHTIGQYNHKSGLWASATVRYDSGLVSNPSDPAEVAADPDYSDLLPYVNLRSDPPRVRPRTIADVVVGLERKLRDSHARWEISLHLGNLANTTALYNFQSIFSGTRLVAPRTAGLRLRWWW
ncbi:MAG: TonB-dependent receptor [Acidobacteria bacterium]|nr:TonB-dependent receptor [Acidobacteriota bacterium]